MYRFSEDWFSIYIPKFNEHLSPLREQACRLLEIGTFEGRSATWMLENIAVHDQSRLDCIDINEYPPLRANLKASGGEKKTNVHIGRSRDVLKTLPPLSFDFIYIDGHHGHVAVMEDAVLSFRLAKIGGIICFDDYLWDDPRFNYNGTPKLPIDAFVSIYQRQIELMEKGAQVWIRKTSD